MTIKFEGVAISNQLREHIKRRYPDRGRFTLLEKESDVPAWKWKNFFYERQSAQEDQIAFWKSIYPDDELDVTCLVINDASLVMLFKTDALMAAFVEFNDAAEAMNLCQLTQVSTAAQRLEAARNAFYQLFIHAAKAAAIAPAEQPN